MQSDSSIKIKPTGPKPVAAVNGGLQVNQCDGHKPLFPQRTKSKSENDQEAKKPSEKNSQAKKFKRRGHQ